MGNISLNNEPLRLRTGTTYIIIDALYLNDIKECIQNIDTSIDVIARIKSVAFPYMDTPFAMYLAKESLFDISQIKKVNYSDVDVKDPSFFSTDTALMVFISETLLLQFVDVFDYDELLDSGDPLINIDYWNSIVDQYDVLEFGLLMSQGIGVDADFDGSGTYKIT